MTVSAEPVARVDRRAGGPAVADPPRFLVWTAALVTLVAVAMAVVGALRTGLSWDEPFHVMRLRNYLDHGWFALDWAVASGGEPDPENNTLVYAPVTMLLLHALGVLTGTESWGTVSTTPEAYAVRHLGVVAIGLLGTAAAAATTRLLLGSWRWALLTAGILLALPMWTGHLMFNIKDVPVATGYSLVTLALVATIGSAGGARFAALRIAGLALGVTLMVGTRPGMLLALAIGVLILALAGGRRHRALVEAALGTAAAAALLVAAYPHLFAHPGLLVRSALQSSSFRGEGASVFYIPFYLLTQFPLVLQLFLAVGIWWSTRFVLQRRRVEPVHAARLALVLAQVGALPLLSVLKDSDLYNGLRQILFTVPAWAVLVTVGLAHALAWAARRDRIRLVGGVAAASLVGVLGLQASLFPYQYTYYNAALDLTGADVQSDYWRTSVPELLAHLPTDGQIVCGPTRASSLGATDGSPEAEGLEDTDLIAGRHSSDSSVDCRTDPLGPLAPRWAADALPLDDALPHTEFYAVIDRGHGTPANCTRLTEVTRLRHWRTVPMSYVAKCRLEPPVLEGTVAFTRLPGENMAPPVWSYAPEGWTGYGSTSAIDAPYDHASLTFAVPDDCGPCSLVLDAEAPDDLVATVDGVTVDVVRSPDGPAVTMPVGAADVWVTFTRSSGGPLGLRVRTIHLVPTGTVQEDLR